MEQQMTLLKPRDIIETLKVNVNAKCNKGQLARCRILVRRLDEALACMERDLAKFIQ